MWALAIAGLMRTQRASQWFQIFGILPKGVHGNTDMLWKYSFEGFSSNLLACHGLVGSCQLNLIHQWELCLGRSSADKKFISEKSLLLPDLNFWVQWLYCCLPFPCTVLNAKIVGPINHYALGIKWCPSPTVGVPRFFSEVLQASRLHVFYQNGNVEVTVWSRLLMHSPLKDFTILRIFANLAHGASHEEYALCRGIQVTQGWFSGLFLQLAQHWKSIRARPWLCRWGEIPENPHLPPYMNELINYLN